MKLVLFNGGRPGLLKEGGVVDIGNAVAPLTGQEAMEAIITRIDSLRDETGRQRDPPL